MRTLPLCFYTLFLCENCCGDVDELVIIIKVRWVGTTFLQCEYYTKLVLSQPATHKKNKKLLEAHNLNIHSKHFPRKQNISRDNVFIFESLHNTQETYLFCLTRCFLFSSASNFFASIAVVCIKM